MMGTELSFSLLVTAFIFTHCLISAEDNPYSHWEKLDEKGKYILEWLVNWEEERIVFNVTVQTLGYVGFGISKRGAMAGADIVMGGVEPNGKPYFSDRYSRIGNQVPVDDVSQDWELHHAWEDSTSGHTFLSFSRPLDTCDEEHDIAINDDALSVLWAFGENDNSSVYHFNNRKSIPLYLRDPDLTPRIIKEDPSAVPTSLDGRNVSVWKINRKFSLPSKRTTYWCDIHKLSLPRKHHIIGFNVKINDESLANTHHAFLYRCNMPPTISTSPVFHPFVNHPGEECYTSNDLGVREIPSHYCSELKLVHAIGGKDVFFPSHVGIPVGETGTNEYFLLQVHYDNPLERTDIVGELTMNVFYTPELREHDGGIMSIGQNLPGSPSIILPPGSIGHTLYGHCSSACTEKMLPNEGIKIVSTLLHTHNSGRRIRIQHFRNETELPFIHKDDNYMFHFQPFRMLKKEVQVLPGDQISMKCVYDTSKRNVTTVGGYSTDQEMCMAFILYYNNLVEYPTCGSEFPADYIKNYLAGANNLTWDRNWLELVATAPPHLTGMTVSQISDSTYVHWSTGIRTRLQKDHIIHQQIEVCPSVKEAAAVALTGHRLPPKFVQFPTRVPQYQSPQTCSP